MDIRVGNIADVPQLLLLYSQLVSQRQPDPTVVAAALAMPSTLVLVAAEGASLLGTATISVRVVPSFGKVGYIDDVVVDTAARGRGLGRQLTEECLRRASLFGCRRVELTSSAKRVEANAMYLKMGFVRRQTNLYRLDLPLPTGSDQTQ